MFFLTVNQVVLILHGDELRPVITFRNVLQAFELPSVHCARSDVASFSGLHNVMKCLHDFLHRRKSVEPVNLVQVYIVKP